MKDSNFKIRVRESHLINTRVAIKPGAEKVHGITGRMVEEKGLLCSETAEKYTKLVWDFQPLTIIEYNILHFDFPMWQNFMTNHKEGRFKHPPVHQVIDVMHYGSLYLGTKKWPKLSALAKQLGIIYDEDSLHDALADIELTWECFLKLKEKGMIV